MRKIGMILLVLFAVCFGQNPCNQPGVIFCSGFEGSTQEINSAWGNSTTGSNVVADPGPFNAAGNKVLKLDMEIMTHVRKGLGAGYDRLYARWYQKFPAGYSWPASHHHGFTYSTNTESGGSAYTPDGCTQPDWIQLEPTQTSNPAGEGGFEWYAYHPGKATQWGDVFGTENTQHTATIPAIITPGRWYCVETMIDMGTPTPTVAGANGKLDLWIDGTHYGPDTCGSWPKRCGGIWFRTCSSLKINYIDFMSSAPGRQELGVAISYDDLVVSTQPIGSGTRVPYYQIPLVITNNQLTPGTVGTTYSTFLTAGGGAKNYTWQIASGSLPPGLTLTSVTGGIRGTPTQAGTFTFTLRVTDQSSPPQTTDKQLSLVINPSTGIVVARDPAGVADIKAQVMSNKLLLQVPANSGYGTIRLLDALGQTVWEHRLTGAVAAESPVLPNGLYVGQIGTGSKAATFRFAIVR